MRPTVQTHWARLEEIMVVVLLCVYYGLRGTERNFFYVLRKFLNNSKNLPKLQQKVSKC